MKIRLQKILAKAGYGSRRSAEEIITAGRVRINNRIAEIGAKADPENDQITVDGKPIGDPEPLKYIAFNKPTGVLSSVKSPRGEPTVRDYIQLQGRLYPVGRLDKDSEGLILMTNDGRLTNKLTHPRYQHEKEYRVQVNQKPNPKQIRQLQQGINIGNGEITSPAIVTFEPHDSGEFWLRMTLTEGKKRQIRRMLDAVGLSVLRLIRVRIAGLRLNELGPGKWRELSMEEVKALKQS